MKQLTYSLMREKSMNLAIRIVNLYKHLTGEKKEYVLANHRDFAHDSKRNSDEKRKETAGFT